MTRQDIQDTAKMLLKDCQKSGFWPSLVKFKQQVKGSMNVPDETFFEELWAESSCAQMFCTAKHKKVRF